MREVWLRIGGILLITAIVYLFLSNIQQGFKPFDYVIFPIEDSLVSTEKEIAQSVSYSLWEQRSLDVILLAFLLFVASACCASILSPRGDAKR